ncbi:MULTISPECIES: transcriptional repressor LexA [Exiguobacterium]|uniref:transcriptional repressor LexA n=2 Tax=Bacillales Family XII. Incertae Sedis TaxID=539742 RepID=UPI0004DF3B57|nr:MULTISPECIES: transcriptional repressor LexA [Exiguobacterium]MBG0917183.1 transcriptional repressor LexA [Exiguobacterium sp. SRB7LM]MCT4796838.1 transcriptional repressor LexA [Exiguobacterium profundum]MCV9899425.1 transcriptional repressor LexA [Exiguobacterium sp. N5]MDT0191720.1 transcriptional repressor LexA [Exiguobacterium sp. BG5(2022)]MDX5979904.1 transcriptional repressor LexA [Exiguobacterium profundum]
MKKMSARQQQILDFIKDEVRAKGYPPSVREIGEAVGLASSSTVHGHLDRLEKRGLIRRDKTKPRAIEILTEDMPTMEEQESVMYVPVIGKVTAGTPITAIENVEEHFPLPAHIVGSDNVYMLSVSGDSMINAGILDGDRVLVRQQSTADNGEIVVAMTEEGEATVKRIYKEASKVRLQPENDELEAMYFDNVSILGKVIGVYRTIH